MHKRKILRISILVIIVFLVVLRFINLDIDPPYFFQGYTQAHLTDPYHLTFFARNAILFDDWNPFDFHRWDIFKYSLVSGFSYLVFLFFGVSRITANITAILLNLGGLALFVLGLYRLRPTREIIIAILLLLSSSMLFFYGRMPFLENGLIFWSGLIFSVAMKYDYHFWGQFLSGFLVALAALSGKLFGAVLIIPVIVTLIYHYRRNAVKPIIATVLGSMAGTLSYLIIFIGGSVGLLKRYYLEQTIGMYGTPEGLQSISGFFKRLILYGAKYGFFDFSFWLIILAGSGLILLMLTKDLKAKAQRESLPLIFATVWLLSGILILMPHNYLPLRYALFLFLPIALIGAYSANLIFEHKIELRLNSRIISLPLTLLIFWYTITQVIILFAPYNRELTWGARVMPFTLILSALITGAIFLVFRKRRRNIHRKYFFLIIPLLAAIGIHQGLLLYRGLALPGRSLKEFSIELGQLVDKNAVITGPYAPALTIDNDLRGFIYHFGLTDIERGLFERFPITHVATDRSNWDLAIRDFPSLKESSLLTLFTIREFMGALYRLPGANVPMTDFERGVTYLQADSIDTAEAYLERFAENNKENLTGVMALANCYDTEKKYENMLFILKRMGERYPDNFRVHVFCSQSYNKLYQETGQDEYRQMGLYYTRRARELNPAIE